MSGTASLVQSLANPPNPLAQLQQTATGIGAMRDFQAKQATAQAYQQSIDPTTGAFDQGKFNALLASTPQGAWNIGPNMQQAGSAMSAQGVGQIQQVNAKIAQLQGISGYMTPLVQQILQGKPVTGQQALDATQQAAAAGLATPEMVANIQKQVAAIGGPNADASNVVRGAYFATGTGMQQLQTLAQPVKPVDVGGAVVPWQSSPWAPGGGGYSGGAPLPTSMSPGQASQMVTIPYGGQNVTLPLGIAVQLVPNSPAVRQLLGGGGAAAGGAGGGAPVTNQSFGPNQGRYTPPSPPAGTPPTTGTGTGAPVTTAPVPAPPVPPATAPPAGTPTAQRGPIWAQPPPPQPTGGGAGGFGVTPAPGYVESQQASAQASTRALTALQAQVSASKDIEPILADMEAQTRTAGFSTGIGSTVAGTVRQLAQRAGLVPETPGPGFDLSNPQQAQEEFAKDAARLQAAQLGALGNPTDARQELSETTNPGLMLSKYGNQSIIHMLQGNQQAIRAMGDAWAQATQNGWTPDRFNEWMNQRFLATDPATGGRFDPRAFWFANAPSLAEQKEYASKIPPGPQRTQFLNNLQYAKNNGWISQAPDGTTVIAGQ